MDSLISALTLSYLLPAAAHIFLFLPIRQLLLRVEYFSGCLIIMIRSIHYFRQVRTDQYENNTKGCTAVTSPLPWHILSYYLLFFTILLNDSCGFHIHARQMYVLPRGCAHGENTSHLDYTQVFH